MLSSVTLPCKVMGLFCGFPLVQQAACNCHTIIFLFQYAFDYRPGDIYACVADIGWITGHSYVVYGPLCNGATSVLFESTPTYPNPGRYWEMVERLRINQFYGAPTAIRLLLRFDDHYVTQYNRSSLRALGTGNAYLSCN